MRYDFPNLICKEPETDDQVMRGMWDTPAAATDPAYGFVDLRPYRDDKTVHRNPNKGWFWHYIDNGYHWPYYWKDHDPADDLADFPGLNHLYLRFDWGDIEKEKGVYDFAWIDEIMELWGKRGYTFALRVCCYESHEEKEFATPRYVFEEGAKCYEFPNGKLQVDFGDEIFFRYLEKFMAVLAEKFNGDPRIELIDIGTIGTWGEGHTVEGEERVYPAEVVRRHFDLHAKYFPDTIVVCNDDHIAGRMCKGIDEVQDMQEYARARGFGVQDDSICCDGYTQDCGYDTMRAPWAFDALAPAAPSVIEMAHYWYIKPQFEAHYRDGFTAIEAFKNAHATFAGFHGYPRPWLTAERSQAEYCANRLGYWYFIHSANIPALSATAHNLITLQLENRGWARAYHKYELRLRLTNGADAFVCPLDADNRTWLPDSPCTLRLKADLRAVPAGQYDVAVGLFAPRQNDRPVYFALKDEICDGGYYTLKRSVTVR